MTELSDRGGGSEEAPTLQNTGVVTTTDIPELVVAGPYPGQFDFGTRVTDEVNVKHVIEVNYRNGRILMEVESSNQWLRYIRAARDRHEQNVEFFRTDDRKIFLRTLRKVKMGEHLFAWFSDPLAREIGVPFLSLQNIQGNQRYVCVDCNGCFKYPNPLKSHMLFSCEARARSTSPEYDASVSPNRIFRPFLDSNQTHQMTDSRREKSRHRVVCGGHSVQHASAFHRPHESVWHRGLHQQLPTPNQNLARTAISTRVSNVLPVNNPVSTSALSLSYGLNNNYYKYISQFLCSPIKHEHISMGKPHFQVPCSSHISSSRTVESQRPESNIPFPLPNEIEGEPLDMLPKSFFANKSKKGHLCIYCGKLYSRKYGLKIHLRTHTGYKPLKCKVCLRPFGDPSNLNKHVRLHAEGETPYRCDFCGKVLVRRRDLERHLKSRHSGTEEHGKNGCHSIVGKDEIKDDVDNEIVVV